MLNSEWLNRTHIYDFKQFVYGILHQMHRLLNLPNDYKIMFVPASGSGAIWCSFLNLLLPERKIHIPVSGYFSRVWAEDLQKQFGLDCNVIEYDEKFNIDCIDQNDDYMMVAVDTSNGMRNLQILDNMSGLVLMDAVSAVFIEDIPWTKVDAVSFAAQKILGGDGSLGVLVLSPKALERLAVDKPWPIPRMFNINRWSLENVENGQFMSTPSILSLIELSHILNWVEQNGGVPFLQQRNEDNWSVMNKFLDQNNKFESLIKKPALRGLALNCIELQEWSAKSVKSEERMEFMKEISAKAKKLCVYDIANFSNPSWRFWLGPMQESEDIAAGLDRFLSLF